MSKAYLVNVMTPFNLLVAQLELHADCIKFANKILLIYNLKPEVYKNRALALQEAAAIEPHKATMASIFYGNIPVIKKDVLPTLKAQYLSLSKQQPNSPVTIYLMNVIDLFEKYGRLKLVLVGPLHPQYINFGRYDIEQLY